MTQLRPVGITIYLLRTIFKQCTGSRQEIANRFNISPQMVNQYIKKLEVETNTTIAFNRIRNSYYYESGKPPFTPHLFKIIINCAKMKSKLTLYSHVLALPLLLLALFISLI